MATEPSPCGRRRRARAPRWRRAAPPQPPCGRTSCSTRAKPPRLRWSSERGETSDASASRGQRVVSSAEIDIAPPRLMSRSALYSASEEYRQLDSVLPGSSASVVAHMHEPVVSFVPNHFDARLHPFGPQCISAGGYSLASVPLYRQAPGHGGLDLSLTSTSSSSV